MRSLKGIEEKVMQNGAPFYPMHEAGAMVVLLYFLPYRALLPALVALPVLVRYVTTAMIRPEACATHAAATPLYETLLVVSATLFMAFLTVLRLRRGSKRSIWVYLPKKGGKHYGFHAPQGEEAELLGIDLGFLTLFRFHGKQGWNRGLWYAPYKGSGEIRRWQGGTYGPISAHKVKDPLLFMATGSY